MSEQDRCSYSCLSDEFWTDDRISEWERYNRLPAGDLATKLVMADARIAELEVAIESIIPFDPPMDDLEADDE